MDKFFKSKKSRQRFYTILSVSLMFLGIYSLVVNAKPYLTYEDLGSEDFTHYNGFLFSGIRAEQADIEGALAVGGDSIFGSAGHGFDVGGAGPGHYSQYSQIGKYENPGGYPTLLLNGKPTFQSSNNFGIYGGDVVLSSSTSGYYGSLTGAKFSRAPEYAGDSLLDGFFAGAKRMANRVSNLLPNASDGAAIEYSGFHRGGYASNISNYVNTHIDFTNLQRNKVVSININGETIRIGEVVLPQVLENYDVVVFNFPEAHTVYFDSAAILARGKIINTSAPVGWWPQDHAVLKLYAEKIIWNFPQATSIQNDGKGIVGSVIAPEALFSARGGSLNGMLVADYLEQKGGFELHAFRMKNIYAPKPDDNYDEKGEILVTKAAYSQDGAPLGTLAGAKFSLWDLDGAPVELPLRQVTNSDNTLEGVYEPDPDKNAGDHGADAETDRYGHLRIINLPLGWYELREDYVPDGYEKKDSDPIRFEITEEFGVENILELEVANVLQETAIRFQKVSSQDLSLGLSGAYFTLFKEQRDADENLISLQRIETVETGDHGRFALSGLTVGHYQLLEIGSPEGYELHADPVLRIEVQASGSTLAVDVSGAPDYYTNDAGTYKVKNDPKQPNDNSYNVMLVKSDATEPSNVLPATEFLVQESLDGESGWQDFGSFTTNGQGMVRISNLDPGKFYRIKETKPPPGYDPVIVDSTPDGWVYFTKSGVDPIKNPGFHLSPYLQRASASPLGLSSTARSPVIPLGASGQRDALANIIEVRNKPNAKIVVEKLNEDGSQHLTGAEFTLYRPYFGGMKVVDTQTVGDDGRATFENLSLGMYFLEETRAPAGYQRDLNIPSIIVDATSLVGSQVVKTVQVFNKTVDVNFLAKKVDADNNAIALPNAVFDLYYYDEATNGWVLFLEHMVTGADGVVDVGGLFLHKIKDVNEFPARTFKAVEVTSPAGYEGVTNFDDSEFIFSVRYNRDTATVNLGTQLVENVRTNSLGKAVITKVDSRDYSTLLAGAQFRLYYRAAASDDFSPYPYASILTTGVDGKLVLEDLQFGYYQLYEVVAPDGYDLLSSPIQFEIWEGGASTTSIRVVNQKTGEDDSRTEDPGARTPGRDRDGGGRDRIDEDPVPHTTTPPEQPGLIEQLTDLLDPMNPSTGAIAAVLAQFGLPVTMMGSGLLLWRKRREE